MKYIDEFRDNKIARSLISQIDDTIDPDRNYTFMEVCGTHTMAVFKFGLNDMLPGNLKLLSGPGCPVCVTADSYIDTAIEYALQEGVVIATFGDMLRVPGAKSSLEKERAKGADVRVVYSCLDAVKMAEDEPDKKLVFLGVGFETTVPTIAASIIEAKGKRLKNFYLFSAHKTMPFALRALLEDESLKLDGLMLPGHVSTIIGSRPYRFIASEFGIPCSITGFEPIDILDGILKLVRQCQKRKADVEIQYDRVVHERGNEKAQRVIKDVFEPCDTEWRGLGVIPNSGLKIRESFSDFDSEKVFSVTPRKIRSGNKGCICAGVLRGAKTPLDCKLFKRECTPENPKGACMVSSEGTCAAYYKYEKG